jgi:uncharacterized RDD family membrane protein YckC
MPSTTAAGPPPPPPPPVADPPVPPRANPDEARNRRVLAVAADLILLGVGYGAAALVAPEGTDWEALPTTLPSALLVFAGMIAYFAILEGAFGQTIGKWLCDVRVVDARRRHASYGQAVVRSILRPVDHFALGAVGAIAIIASGSGKRQRIGDSAAGTFVVRASKVDSVRADAGTIAVVGIALALLPLLWFAAPVAGTIVPISSEHQAREAAHRYLTALSTGNAVDACTQMTTGYRRAVIAMDRSTGSGTTPADCAVHAKIVLATAREHAGSAPADPVKQEVSFYGGVAYVGLPNRPLLRLRREDGNWRVDPDALVRGRFVDGCTGARAPERTCGCMFDELRVRGVLAGGDIQDVFQRLGQTDVMQDPMVQAAFAACGAPTG